MNAKQQCFADLKRFALTLQGVLAAAQELDAIGSIEQATAEAQARLDALHVSIEPVTAQLAFQKSEHVAACDKLKADADQYVAGRKSEGDKLIADAELRAAHIVDGAKTNAEDLIATAEKQAGERAKAIGQSTAELAALKAAISKAKDELDQINSMIPQAHAALATVKESHAAFLSSIGAGR